MIKILDGDCPDPAVFREGDTFYLTYSSGPYYPGLPICSSTDLVNWKMETYAVKDFEGKEIWAPDFFKYKDNKYYIYFSGAGTNWVIWSEHIQGPWSEPIDLKVGYIDPGHVTDEEGKRYLLLSGGHIVPPCGGRTFHRSGTSEYKCLRRFPVRQAGRVRTGRRSGFCI